MPPFVNLPWLNSSDQFLQAMLAGGKAGLEREQMKNDLAREAIRSFRLGGGGPAANPLSAQAQAWREQYQQSLLDDADKRLELAEERNRISEANAGRFQFLQPGLGQIARGNPITGEVETLQEAREIPNEPTATLPFYSGDPMLDALSGVQPVTLRGTVSQLAPYSGANASNIFGNFQQVGQAAMTPSPVSPGGPRSVTTQEEFDSLNSGDIYIGADGRRYRKP